MKIKTRRTSRHGWLRKAFLLAVVTCSMLTVVGYSAVLQYHKHDFLIDQAQQRQVRTVKLAGFRGSIKDRNGHTLAVSAPVLTAYVDASKFYADRENFYNKYLKRFVTTGKASKSLLEKITFEHSTALRASKSQVQRFQGNAIRCISQLLDISIEKLHEKLSSNQRFIYLKRHIDNLTAKQIEDLRFYAGVSFFREYKRYYPRGEETVHVVGTTNIDDHGLEGIEKTYDTELRGSTGQKRVLRDLRRRTIGEIEMLQPAIDGTSIQLSIDQNIQYAAYLALTEAVLKHQAISAMAVVIDAHSGEIIAMVNYPSFNPNDKTTRHPYEYRRNRVITDMYEMGSVMKPITIASVLDGGHATADEIIDTSPGYLRVGTKEIKDKRNYGQLSLGQIISKSSNVGASKAALLLKDEEQWTVLRDLGFGQYPSTGFPGETQGILHFYKDWERIDRAVASYGYGVSVSLLQLAHAYTAFANDGWQPSLSFIKGNPHLERNYIFKEKTSMEVRKMLKTAVGGEGTGNRAQIPGYTTAGKTGTVRKIRDAVDGEQKYLALFVGIAPATNPRFVATVLIDEPKSEEYYGGQTAAPVFAKIMEATLTAFNIPRDGEPQYTSDELRNLFLAKVAN